MTIDSTDTTTSFLEQILDSVHPLMAEALYMAALPQWYDAALFTAVRSQSDDRSEGLVTRLARYSFVERLPESGDSQPLFTVRSTERMVLQRRWIAKDPQAYRQAHQRTLAYWLANPDPNPFAQTQNRLYHQLFVDIRSGMDYLVDRFRAYHQQRQLGAIERLLDTVLDARFYLVMLGSENLDQLDDLVIHLRARLSQLRGVWQESRQELRKLLQKSSLAPWLLPYVARAYGYALSHDGKYVEAVEQYELAMKLFNQQAATLTDAASVNVERAHTMISLGEAHVELATSISGPARIVFRPFEGEQRLRDFFYFFLSLPLVFYLSFYLGRRVWHPRFWSTLKDMDWIVARLFATGARLYAKADPVLERYGSPSEGVYADEQLAFLYLAMGDAEQALASFNDLQAEKEAPLDEYRRGVIRIGLGKAALRLGHYEVAQNEVEAALTVLAFYEDAAAYAEGEMLLAEVHLAMGESAAAVSRFGSALASYQNQSNEIMATEAAERLERVAAEPELSESLQQSARELAGIEQRRYPVLYRHPATVLFHRAALGLLALIIFVIFASIIRLETGISVTPEITFNASPLLRSDAPDFRPDLSQGVVALSLSTIPDPKFLLWLGILLFAGYLVFSTLIGILIIAKTPLNRIQADAEAETVRFDGETVRVGTGPASTVVRLENVVRCIRADLFFARALLVDDSDVTLITAGERLRLKGNTAWYSVLQTRIEALLPTAVDKVDFSYSMLLSRMGGWYLVTILLLSVLGVLGRLAPALVAADLPGLRYSVADIYPFLYLGLMLPPVWWFVVQPIRLRLQIDPYSRLALWIGSAGALMAVMRLVTLFRPWLTVPDIYPPVLIVLLLGGGAAGIWLAKGDSGETVYPTWLRAGAVVVLLLTSAMMGVTLWREAGSYHALVMGDYWRDQAMGVEAPEKREALAETAVDRYSRALAIGSEPVPGFDARPRLWIPMGIPRIDRFLETRALSNRAAMWSELGAYSEAIKDYSELLRSMPKDAGIYAARAMAYQSAGTAPGEEQGTLEVIRRSYEAALSDFGKAIVLEPQNAALYLWRGSAHHALGEEADALDDYETSLSIKSRQSLDSKQQAKAYTGLGWLAYRQGAYEQASQLFSAGLDAYDSSSEARLGLGYTFYTLRQYENALEAWEAASETDTSDPTIFISLGTLYWRVGTLGDDFDASGADRCASGALSEADKRKSAEQLEQSLAFLSRSTPLPGQDPVDVAFTFRTMGQVQFLLRECPGYDAAGTISAAVDNYSEAINLDPDNAGYWHMRSRLSYSVWANSPAGSGPAAREWLFDALSDSEKALELDPVDQGGYLPHRWYDIIFNEAVVGTMSAGDVSYAKGEFELAFGYYALVAENQLDRVDAAFLAGKAALAAGEQAEAAVWYQTGIERAIRLGQEELIQQAREELIELVETQGDVDINAIEDLLQQSGVDLSQPLSPELAFEWGLEALAEGNEVAAIQLYAEGLALVRDAGDVSTAAEALLSSLTYPAGSEILTAFRLDLTGLVQPVEAGDSDVEAAFKLALIAAAVGEDRAAGRWYNEGVRRAAVLVNYPPIQASRDDLRSLWTNVASSSAAILSQMERQLPGQLGAFPDLIENGLYWRFRAWFKYGLGQAAFRSGQEKEAASALQSAQADAKTAFDLDAAGNTYVQTYLAEGAWGWYHVERGNDNYAEGDFEAALADYEAAAALIQPVANADAKNEVVLAAFKAGLTALQLQQPEQALTWYKLGLDLADRYESDSAILANAIEELERLQADEPNLALQADGILEQLTQE